MLSRALAAGDLTAVLAAEAPLADAVRRLPPSGAPLAAAERESLTALIHDARGLLDRCRRLGDAARELAAAGLTPHRGYGRAGTLVPDAHSTIESRS